LVSRGANAQRLIVVLKNPIKSTGPLGWDGRSFDLNWLLPREETAGQRIVQQYKPTG
jgi:hypothetical protein